MRRWLVWVCCGTVLAQMAATPSVADEAFAADRGAVLRLAGAYAVTRRVTGDAASPGEAASRQIVVVAEDTGRRVVLRHLLVMGEPAVVVLGGRQEWSFVAAGESASRPTRVGADTYAIRPVPGTPAAADGWVRSVYGVDGTPGRHAWGRWTHDGAGPRWEAVAPAAAALGRHDRGRTDGAAWREALDRVALGRRGWVRRTEETKRGDGTRPVVAGAVLERFVRAEGVDFGPALRHWDEVGAYWAGVRSAWASAFAAAGDRPVGLRSSVGGVPRWRALADGAASPTPDAADVLAPYLVLPDDRPD
ncbi:MAG: DUF6607 family protein [Planctomycetota bacterium]